MDYHEYRRRLEALESARKAASERLRAMPGAGSGPMGLTPDSAKSPEWRAAKANHDAAFEAVRRFNAAYAKRFKRDIVADIEARRMAKLEGMAST